MVINSFCPNGENMSEKSYFSRQKKIDSFTKAASRSLLTHLDLELTERCNNNCIHCYINQPEDDTLCRQKELSFEDLRDILRQAVSLGCLSVRFTGGEPLLREDFSEIYLFARRLGLRVFLFTNACLLSEETARLLSRVPPLEKVEVSVYGMSRSSYEAATRRPGSFKEARNGIDLLLKYKIPFVVKGAFLPASVSEIDEFERWASDIPGMRNQPPGLSIFFDLRGRRDSPERNRKIEEIRPAPADGLAVMTRHRERYLEEMRQFCGRFMGVPGDKLFSCGAGVKSGCVDAYGNLQLCMTLRHPGTVYSLKGGSLKDALVDFFPAIREKRAENAGYFARCARCFLKGLCGQCPAKSWMEHGVLDRPVEYLCDIAHGQARYIGLLSEGEKAWEVDGRQRVERFTQEG